jgi:plasmid maintenance system killer protein
MQRNSTEGIQGRGKPRPRTSSSKSGDRKGFWAVTVRANWRIVFRFEGGHAIDVELIDYH